MSYAAHAEDWSRTIANPASWVYVAADEVDQMVGFVAGGPRWSGPERYAAELYAWYVCAEQQGRGVGTRLVMALATGLDRAGLSSMLLWVLRENRRACAFYESLGGVAVAAQEFEIDGVSIGEVAYGWDKTRALLERLRGRDRSAGTTAASHPATSPSSSSSRSGS